MDALTHILDEEAPKLGPREGAWWAEHRIAPEVVELLGRRYYAVARSRQATLLYFDQLESFGTRAAPPWDDGLVLYRDLPEAARRLAAEEDAERIFARATAELLEVYERGDAKLRDRILVALRFFGPGAATAVPRLIEIARDREARAGFQEAAVATLGGIGPAAAAAVPRLIEMVESDEANARGHGIQALGRIGPAAAAAVPLLADLLLRRARVDPDPFYASLAAGALGAIGSIEALPSLLLALSESADADPALAVSVVEAIGRLGPAAAEAEAPLLSLADGCPVPRGEEDPERSSEEDDAAWLREELRKTAIEALRRIGKAIPPEPE